LWRDGELVWSLWQRRTGAKALGGAPRILGGGKRSRIAAWREETSEAGSEGGLGEGDGDLLGRGREYTQKNLPWLVRAPPFHHQRARVQDDGDRGRRDDAGRNGEPRGL
jgi:hypothetical protein